MVGLLLGILLAAVLTVAMYFGALRLNLTTFFRYTAIFLIVVAAGILSYGVSRSADRETSCRAVLNLAFNLTPGYDPSTWYGTVLAGIFNFRPDPTVLQAVAWVVYLVVVLRALPTSPSVEPIGTDNPACARPHTFPKNPERHCRHA